MSITSSERVSNFLKSDELRKVFAMSSPLLIILLLFTPFGMWPLVYDVGVEVVSLIGGALIFPVSSPGAVRGVFGSLTWKESDITFKFGFIRIMFRKKI